MINGTCVHCDADKDLVPICLSCAQKKVTMVSKEAQITPLKAVSRKIEGPAPDIIKSTLKSLREECGFGIPDGHE